MSNHSATAPEHGENRRSVFRAPTSPSVFRMIWFPAATALFTLLLSLLRISGSSTGAWYALTHVGKTDANLLIGVPRPITSDMWYVQDSWIASQVAQGLPSINRTLPGGMDATFMNDLPSLDWSTLFRPHLWGYFTGSLAFGGSWRWWFIGAFAASAVYLFAITLLPRRPLVSAGFALIVIASPLLQWWYRPQALLPVGWAFMVAAAAIWALRAEPDRRGTRIVLTVLAGYFAVPTALTIYVPFIVPCALVAAFVVLGALVEQARIDTWKRTAPRLLPLVGAAIAAALILLAWAIEHREAIAATTATVYPGARDTETGTCALALAECARHFSALWDRPLLFGSVSELGPNQPESSSPLALALYLFPATIIFAIQSIRSRRPASLAITLLVLLGLFLAFLYVPGWDELASLFLLNRTFGTRLRIGFLVLGVVMAIMLVRDLDEHPWSRREGRIVGAVTALVVAVVFVTVRFSLWGPDLDVPRATALTAVLVHLGCAFLAIGRPPAGVALLVVASLALAAGVNPFYRGWTDLRATPIGKAIAVAENADPGSWVGVTTGSGIDTMAPTGFLLAAGVEAYNGVQTYPPAETWERIDPTGTYANQWNRLAAITWVEGDGEPVIENPARDQIQISFDACSTFAQSNVRHVFSTHSLSGSCLALDSTAQWGDLTGYIYTVVAR